MKDEVNAIKLKRNNLVNSRVRNGKFPPATTMVCEICQENLSSHYHHHQGYAWENRVDVISVCSRCHPEADRHVGLPLINLREEVLKIKERVFHPLGSKPWKSHARGKDIGCDECITAPYSRGMCVSCYQKSRRRR